VRAQLAAKGTKTIRGLGRAFRTLDSMDGNRKIDKEEFYWGIKDQGIEVTKKEAEIILDFFDTDDDGFVNFDEFLIGIRVSNLTVGNSKCSKISNH
jgi:Ca2+-binding EF-hand superfamily protein